jgi:hypothetical protein
MDLKPEIEPRFLRTPTDFEEAAADWMRLWGYHLVRRTRTGPDGGIDVESIEAVAQVKAWMVPIASPEIQQLKGAAYDGRSTLFFSLMHYTAAAVRFADEANVLLFRFSGYSGEIEPANDCARKFLTDWRRGSNITPDDVRGCLCSLLESKLNYVISHPGFFFFIKVKRRERYVQGLSDYVAGVLVIESVGPKNLFAGLTATETLRFNELGWPANTSDDTNNYRIEYSGRLSSQQLKEIAELLAFTLIDVYGVEIPEDIEVTIDETIIGDKPYSGPRDFR